MHRFCRYVCLAVTSLFVAGCVTDVSFRNANLGVRNDIPVQTVSGLFAKPDGKGPFPAVVLLHTCGGVLPHVSDDWPNFLTGHGIATLTVDTFGSRGAGRCPEAREFGGVHMWRDAYGALDYLANRPDIDGSRIGVMGFSLGASAVEAIAGHKLKSPENRNFRAGISLYGQCVIDGTPTFPILFLIGDQDRNSASCPSPPGPGVSVEILKGATHAFDNTVLTSRRIVSGGHSSIYDADATEKARRIALAFLGKQMGVAAAAK